MDCRAERALQDSANRFVCETPHPVGATHRPEAYATLFPGVLIFQKLCSEALLERNKNLQAVPIGPISSVVLVVPVIMMMVPITMMPITVVPVMFVCLSALRGGENRT